MATSFAVKLKRVIRRRMTLRAAAWALLALVALASVLPPGFSSTARLTFETGIQPPAAAVRGVMQLLGARDLARDALARLPSGDAARLGARSLADMALDGGAPDTIEAAEARAARRLMAALTVAPQDNGRAVGITVRAATPNLAARAADAYAAAFLALDAGVRADPEFSGALIPVKLGTPAARRFIPDPPAPLALVLIALGAAILLLAGHRLVPRRRVRGKVAGDALPVPVCGRPGVAWLDAGAEAGLPLETAARRLAAVIETPSFGGRLTILSGDDDRDGSAELALGIARRLAETSRVVLVALDGKAGPFGSLVADPLASGVSELLFGVAGFGETIHRDALSHAHVIPPGRDARSDAGMLAADRLPMVLESLRRTYDHVIVGAPSLTGVPEAAALAEIGPLMVCIHSDATPATTAVERFDALAGARFPQAVMLRLASASHGDDAAGVPSLDAEAPTHLTPLPRHRAPLPRLAGAA